MKPLKVGDSCYVQNQVGPHATKWDRTGLIVEVLPCRKYRVKLHGSGRLTNRNRKFLRLYRPHSRSNKDFLPVKDRPVNRVEVVDSKYDQSVPAQVHESVKTPSDPPTPSITPESENVSDDRNTEREDINVGIQDHDQHQGDPATPMKPIAKVPLAVRRLETFNKPGLLDSSSPPTTRLRKRL